jgi:hypothetical protein
METNYQIEELGEKYKRFYAGVLEEYEGTSKEVALKESIKTFETETAPDMGLFPQDRRYIIEKTAVVAKIARKIFPEKRGRGIENLLGVYEFSDKDIVEVKEAIKREYIPQIIEEWKKRREAKIVHKGE